MFLRRLARSFSAKVEVPADSIVPEGTVLKGLNILNGKKDPVAMHNKDYPVWLWGLLEEKKTEWSDQDKLSIQYLRSLSKKKIVTNSLNKK